MFNNVEGYWHPEGESHQPVSFKALFQYVNGVFDQALEGRMCLACRRAFVADLIDSGLVTRSSFGLQLLARNVLLSDVLLSEAAMMLEGGEDAEAH